MKKRSLLFITALTLLTTIACEDDGILVHEVYIDENQVGSCSETTPCPDGYLCVGSTCVPHQNQLCDATQAPQLIASSQSLQLGNIASTGEAEKKVEIENQGDCTLILTDVGMQVNDGIFECIDCTEEAIHLAPLRRHTFTIRAATNETGAFSGTFLASTNDPRLPNGGQFELPVEATHLGTPDLAIEPIALSYGYIPVGDVDAMGERRWHSRPFELSNVGSGEQPIFVRVLAAGMMQDRLDFQKTGLPGFPDDFIELKPGESLSDYGSFNVRFQTPSSGMAQNYEGNLIVETYAQDPNAVTRIEVPVTATSISPAVLEHPSEVEFLCEEEDACAVNIESKLRMITLSNIGQTDFKYDRVFLTTRSAQVGSDLNYKLISIGNSHETGENNLMSGVVKGNGGFLNIHVEYDPIDASDIESPEFPSRSHDAKLVFRNDIEDRNIEIDLRGWGRIVPNRDSYSIELSWNKKSGNDFRTAFLEVSGNAPTAPAGSDYRYQHSCLLDVSGNNPEYCNDEWRYGDARYDGPGQNPQYMSFSQMPTEEAREAVFDINVRYPSACIRVNPNWGLAIGGVLAVVNIVLAFAYGFVLPIDVNETIEQVNNACKERAPLVGRVNIKQNGEIVHFKNFTMSPSEEGLSRRVLTIRRTDTMELEFENQ